MDDSTLLTANALHKAAIRLLRLLRREDSAVGLSAPRLSALSVLAFGGPCTLSALASAEQVALPTMSRLIGQLEAAGLVQRTIDPTDRRSAVIHITHGGQVLMEQGRQRRLARLAGWLETLPKSDRRRVEQAVPVLLALGQVAPPEPRA